MSAVIDEYDEQAGFAEIMLERQWMAEQVARRMELGLSTQEDADWVRREFGITD